MLLIETKTEVYFCPQLWKSNKIISVWTNLVLRQSINCILSAECGEIWPWEIFSRTVAFTALCAHGCLVLNYAAGNVIWPQHRQEASYRGLIFSKPKRKKTINGHLNFWIYSSILSIMCLIWKMPLSAHYIFLSYVFVCMFVWESYVPEMLICRGGFIVLMMGHVS